MCLCFGGRGDRFALLFFFFLNTRKREAKEQPFLSSFPCLCPCSLPWECSYCNLHLMGVKWIFEEWGKFFFTILNLFSLWNMNCIFPYNGFLFIQVISFVSLWGTWQLYVTYNHAASGAGRMCIKWTGHMRNKPTKVCPLTFRWLFTWQCFLPLFWISSFKYLYHCRAVTGPGAGNLRIEARLCALRTCNLLISNLQ